MFAQQALQPKLSRYGVMVMSDKLCRKGWSSGAQKTETVTDNDGSRTVSGKKFHKVGPETAKHRMDEASSKV